MADAFLSTIWYRVADLTPRLRSHISVHRHRYRGQAWYVLHDHGAGKIHRFTPAAYQLIGQWDGSVTVDAAWTLLAQTHDADAPSQDDVIQLLSQLHQNDLIQYPGSPDVGELLERYNRTNRQLLKQNVTNPVSIRVPLWDPDAFLTKTLPAVRWLTGWVGLLLWAVVVVAGGVTAAQNWEALTTNLTDQLFASQNILIGIVTYPLLKAAHELAHGYLAKARGGEVREMGIMFLVFFPVPYVDASSAAAFPNKWHRAAVSAGGIFVETFAAAIAVMIWASAQSGLITAIAFSVASIGGISTLVVNGNPLLKFDGYYVLSDLIEIPNFGTRANKFIGHLIQRYLFKAKHLREKSATWGERVWFVIYAPAAFVYRLIVMFGIAMVVASKFFVVGVFIALWSVFNAIIKPSFKNLRHVVTAPGLRKVRSRAYWWTFGGIAVVLAALLFVPLPLRTDTEAVVWLPEQAYLRAGTSGFIQSVKASPGVQVAQNETVLVLQDPSVTGRIEALSWRVEEQRRRLTAAQVEDRGQVEIISSQMAEDQATLDREKLRVARMTLSARQAGTFQPAIPTNDLEGRYVAEGDLLGYLVPERASLIRMVVPQDDIGLVREKLTGVSVKVVGALDQRFETHLLTEVPSGVGALPSPALGASAGGRFLTDPTDEQGLKVTEPIFVFDLAMPDSMDHAPFGARVLVRMDHGYEPVLFQIYRRVRQVFLRQFSA